MQDAIRLINKGRVREGKKALEKLNRKTPNDYDILYYLGIAQTKLGELKSAEKNLKKCIHINPNASGDHAALGDVYKEKGENKLAEFCYKVALMLEPENPYNNHRLGSLYRRLNDTDKTIYYYAETFKYMANKTDFFSDILLLVDENMI